MEKRTIKLGDYDTAANGLWTLAAWDFPEPAMEANLVNVPGRAKGPLDLSTALTGGEPIYGARELTVILESSEGDRLARKSRISEMVNKLHGRRVDIVLPDDPQRYATGRLAVQLLYNDMAHASVQVTGICEPWLYAKDETVVHVSVTTTQQTKQLQNNGAMSVVPLVTITAVSGKTVNLSFGSYSWSLSQGDYELPDLLLTPGNNAITYSGTGTAKFTYREAYIR